MNIKKLLVLFIPLGLVVGVFNLAYEGLYRKTSYTTGATYKIPNSSVELVLERRHIHLFLAEYERTLLVRSGTTELLRKEIAVDTGGHSRLNIYQIAPTEYFLSGDHSSDRYFLDVSKVAITQDMSSDKPKDAKFIGAFDRDENRQWRFIPAYERAEQIKKN